MTDFARLDELTAMLTRAKDTLRSLPPKDREGRARVNDVHEKVFSERGAEILRLSQAGRSFTDIGAQLEHTDPYRRGTPGSRPARKRRDPPDRTRRTR
jgi:hypothetical protein